MKVNKPDIHNARKVLEKQLEDFYNQKVSASDMSYFIKRHNELWRDNVTFKILGYPPYGELRYEGK